MTGLLRSLILSVLLASNAFGAMSIAFEWGVSPDDYRLHVGDSSREWVTWYRLYWGPASGTYTNSMNVLDATNCVFTRFGRGDRLFFVVTAGTPTGLESDPSNQLEIKVPGYPAPPGGLAFSIQIESSDDLKTWNPAGGAVWDTDAPRKFFRLSARVEPSPASSGLKAASTILAPVKSPFTSKRMLRRPTVMPPLP